MRLRVGRTLLQEKLRARLVHRNCVWGRASMIPCDAGEGIEAILSQVHEPPAMTTILAATEILLQTTSLEPVLWVIH